jgi:hypothetical protein
MLKLTALVVAVYTAGTPGVNGFMPERFAQPMQAFHHDVTRGVVQAWNAGIGKVSRLHGLERVASAYRNALR